MMTAMCSLTQRLLDNFPTVGTVLTGVVRWNSNRYHTKHLAEIFQPFTESRPGRVGDGLSQLSISDHITHLQVLIGNQIVRLGYASCQLHGKIFTLPTYLEVLSRETVSRFGSIRAFLGTRKSLTQAFKRFLRLPQVTGILYSLPVRVCIEVGQSNIQPNILLCWCSLLNSLDIKAELHIVPISTTNNSHPLNLIQLIEVQVTGSPQLEAPRLKTIGERDSSSIFRQLPSCCFVLNRAMCLMLLKTRETLFSWLAFFTVVVEPSDRTPSSFSSYLVEP